MAMVQDPSSGIAPDLLPHVHLVSTFRFPITPRVDSNEVTKWLMQAPQIAKDRAPFSWMYLDRPTDGTILLTWQPLQRLGTNFASDGYVWAHPEQYSKYDLGNGLMLEVYVHKSGYIPQDQYALHSRRRFRLVPSGMPNTNAPQPDVSLWVVHYGPADPKDRVPVNVIPFTEMDNLMLNTRMYLQKCGQIQRKDFMLSDRVNWPQIPFPREAGPRQPVGYPQPPAQRGVPQQMAYPPHQPTGPPSKRARHGQAGPGQPPQQMGVPHLEATFDDEEDTSRGDMFDNLTPREIALSRFQQNHEWMEEILSSPYRMGQIAPADLGLGLKGLLAPLTEGIFTAQGADALKDAPEKPFIGRLDPTMADEFRKRVEEHMKSTNEEIEKIKEEHAKVMATLKANSVINHAEKELRSSDESGPEPWSTEGKTEDGEDGSSSWSKKHPKTEDIVAQVEQHLGKKVEVLHDVRRVQDGGYQSPAPEPIPEPIPEPVPAQLADAEKGDMSHQESPVGTPQSGVMIGDSDIDMGGTAAGLLDQMHGGFSATSTPINNFPTPQPQLSAIHSSAATPAHLHVPSPAPIPAGPSAEAGLGQSQPTGEDVAMGGTEAAKAAGGEQAAANSDWVMVPKGGVSPEHQHSGTTPTGGAAAAAEAANTAGLAKQQTTSAVGTPAVTDPGSAAFDQNDFSSLGDLDTAGDALAGYDGGVGDDLGDGLDLHMDMEESAFGDAFHGADTPADGHGDGL